MDPSAPWVGNVLNDNRETFDAGSDQLRATDEDRTEFSDVGDEGEQEHDYLEPGDMVALYS